MSQVRCGGSCSGGVNGSFSAQPSERQQRLPTSSRDASHLLKGRLSLFEWAKESISHRVVVTNYS